MNDQECHQIQLHKHPKRYGFLYLFNIKFLIELPHNENLSFYFIYTYKDIIYYYKIPLLLQV